MPFTASHPALILPLLRSRFFSASGLIMGSMVPDFEFFMRLSGEKIHGHTILGMFWFNVPVALAFIFYYHLCVRNSLVANLPRYFKERFLIFTDFDFLSYFKSNYKRVIYSIIFGNCTHIAWDAFTHMDGYFVDKFPILRTPVNLVPLYDVLQYGCSALAGIYILHYLSTLPRKKLDYQTIGVQQFAFWILVFSIALVVSYIRLRGIDSFTLGEFLVVLISGFLIGLGVSSFTNDQLQRMGIYKTS